MRSFRLSLRRVTLAVAAVIVALGVGGSASSLFIETAAGHPSATSANIVQYTAVAAVPGLDVPVQLAVPAPFDRSRPVRVLVVLHGMGSSGPAFSAPLIAPAVAHGWVVVAPTFVYGDWKDANVVKADDAKVIPAIRSIVDGLPERLGVSVEPRVLVYGFSRGAQVAHRFAFFYPDRVAAVAAFSAGTYTVPFTSLQDGSAEGLAFPYGVADLQKYTGEAFNPEALRNVYFMVGVGRDDNAPADVPRSWDRLLGDCRSDRAAAFTAALQEIGVPAHLEEFAQAKHEQTEAMRAAAFSFLSDVADGPTSQYDLP